MGTDLKLVMPLLRTLNESPELRMNYKLLCQKLSISVQDLQDTASDINEIEPLLVQDGEDLVLLKKLDLLDANAIYAGVNMRGRFVLKDVCTSTNLELIDEKDNLVTGDALVAEIQTQGRSLRGTKWITSIGTNIMLSMSFKFDALQSLMGFSLAVGVACVNALEQLGIQNVKLKWPNDVVYDNKKLAGILIESVPTSENELFAIVGVGINVHRSKTIEASLDRPFTTLEDIGYNVSRNDVCINLINELKYAANTFRRQGLAPFIETWHKHDALLRRLVEVELSSYRRVSGCVAGVNTLGELILDSNSGRTAIRSGHIVSVGNKLN